MREENHLNLKNVDKELKLIMDLLKYQNCIEKINNDLFSDVNWDLFLDYVNHHRVFSVIYTVLKKLDKQIIPSFVMNHLHNQYQQNTFQMLHFSAAMQKVCQLFSSNDIHLLLLKGPTLGHDLYSDISLRTSSDLDMLIPIDQLEKAEKLLRKEGYEKDDYFQTVFNDWKWRHHHVTYYHHQTGVKVELHWRLHPGPAKEPSFIELWERRDRTTLTDYPIYTLKKEDLFLFLASHGARHGWSRLRWLLDINQLIKQDMDWAEVHSLLQKYHTLHVGVQAIILSSQLLEKTANIKLLKFQDKRSIKLAEKAIFYFEQKINLHTDPVPAKVSRYHKSYLFSLMSMHQRFLFILSFLHPYPEDVEILPLPKKIRFLYFPLRPVLWVWRKGRNIHSYQIR